MNLTLWGAAMWRQTISLALCGSLLVACGDDEDGGGDASATTSTSHTFSAGDCTSDGFSVPLGVTTEVPEEIEYLDEIVACTNDDQSMIWLGNRSDAVWEIYLDGEPQALDTHGPLETAFNLAAGGTAFAPGDDLVFPSYVAYEWHVNDGLSAAWVGYELMYDTFASLGQAWAVDALDARTKVGAAALQCAFAFQDVAGVDGSDDGEEVLVDVFEAGAGGAQCRASLGSIAYVDNAGQEVLVLDDVARLKGQAVVVEEVSTKLRFATAASKFAQFVLRLR